MLRPEHIHRIGPLLLLATVAWLSSAAISGASAGPAAEFRKGIGIGAMAWASIEPGPQREFTFPPFSLSDPSYALTFDELQTLRRTGFDFVRLAVDPGPFLQFQGARRDALDGILIDRVRLILTAGLAVIVDFHPSDMHPDYTAQALTAGLNTPLYRSYLQLIARTASLLARLHSRKVALEFMNEPPVPTYVWQPMLEAAYAAARGQAAELLLVLEGGGEGSPDALTALAVGPFANDPAVVFSFHYYEPYQFTHQGASWNAARYLADVPYPAFARPLEDSLQATAAAIAATDLPPSRKASAYRDAQTRLQSYRWSQFGRRQIATTFEQVANWAQSQAIPDDRIMLGEFGARKTKLQESGIRAAERAQWFHDVREQAQAHGFSWCVFAYRGGAFGLVRSETSNDIEPNIAEALGLALRAHSKAAMPAILDPATKAADWRPRPPPAR